MNILHIVAGLEKASGVSVFAGELAAQQAADGHEVAILVKTRHAVEYPIASGVKVVSFAPNSSLEIPDPVDIVHVHALWDPWLTNMAKDFRQRGAKVVWSPHGMLTPWALKNKWPKKVAGLLLFQYWALRKADLLHATAESEVEDIKRLWLKNKIVLAPLGVHLKKGLGVRGQELGGGREKYICFVSRVQRKKGLPNLLKAWAQLPTGLKQGWKVKIAGPDQDNHTAELRALAAELKITDDIEFLGPVYDDDKDALYVHAAFSVLPTHSENFGSVVIESLAQETPVICTKGAPWKDLVDYHCGWWIDIGVEPLAKALMGAISMPEDGLRELGRNGRALVEAKYTWLSVAKTLEDAYGA